MVALLQQEREREQGRFQPVVLRDLQTWRGRFQSPPRGQQPHLRRWQLSVTSYQAVEGQVHGHLQLQGVQHGKQSTLVEQMLEDARQGDVRQKWEQVLEQ